MFSFHARNFLSSRRRGLVDRVEDGLLLRQPEIIGEEEWVPEANLAILLPDMDPAVNCAWFRGGYYGSLTILWRQISEGILVARPPITEGDPSFGGSVFVEKTIPAGDEITIPVLFAWYVPNSELNVSIECAKGASPKCDCGPGTDRKCHAPWYAGRFDSTEAVVDFWRKNYGRLRDESSVFSDTFYDTTLAPELVEAAAANLAIMKSPTVLRQPDGALWGWEGCDPTDGCCPGSCTHVWNYAQAFPHLFPSLERTLRETEFLAGLDPAGHQDFRSPLPIRTGPHAQLAAADGQLGGIIKLYRDYRICGDRRWLVGLWPEARRSLEYCIATWDPEETGILREPQHNTYDIEFWGPNGMCSSIYLAALKAAELLCAELGAEPDEEAVQDRSGGGPVPIGREVRTVAGYRTLYEKGRSWIERELWNGEYFYQKTAWTGLKTSPREFTASLVNKGYAAPEAAALLESEGPKHQYGTGCLSDGVIGAWMARCAGLPDILDPEKVRSHLRAVFRYNFRSDLSLHPNTQRQVYAFGREAGLLLCSWPAGGKPTIPFVYSDEVWTGIEYQVASHLLAVAAGDADVEAALTIVRGARARYDGIARNPFEECEIGRAHV